jgi:hypothetical protein
MILGTEARVRPIIEHDLESDSDLRSAARPAPPSPRRGARGDSDEESYEAASESM